MSDSFAAAAEARKAIKEVLVDMLLSMPDGAKVDMDVLSLAVKAKHKDLSFGVIVGELMYLGSLKSVNVKGYGCGLSALDMLASL